MSAKIYPFPASNKPEQTGSNEGRPYTVSRAAQMGQGALVAAFPQIPDIMRQLQEQQLAAQRQQELMTQASAKAATLALDQEASSPQRQAEEAVVDDFLQQAYRNVDGAYDEAA